jgi:hypothetical protein
LSLAKLNYSLNPSMSMNVHSAVKLSKVVNSLDSYLPNPLVLER